MCTACTQFVCMLLKDPIDLFVCRKTAGFFCLDITETGDWVLVLLLKTNDLPTYLTVTQVCSLHQVGGRSDRRLEDPLSARSPPERWRASPGSQWLSRHHCVW